MNVGSTGAMPVVAVGTLSGNLPTSAGTRTLGSAPMAAGQLAPSGAPVGLAESKAVTGVVFTPFATPQVSADNPNVTLMQQQLLALQEQG